MRTIIAGSRTLGYKGVVQAMASYLSIYALQSPTVVISGCASGVDKAGERWAEYNGIPVERYPAKWHLHGRSAGLKRNVEMAKYADALVAVWDGKSTGTKHMIEHAKKVGLRVFVHVVKPPA